MNIAVINIPLKDPHDSSKWITVPPKGYGGIQWVVTTLIDGLLELGHVIWLLGAPNSISWNKNLHIVNAAEEKDIIQWLLYNKEKIDIIHDHSNSDESVVERISLIPYISTHHLTGKPKMTMNCVYISYAQRSFINSTAPIVRLPVNPSRYCFKATKADYFLMLGRVSPWKGVYEAAQFSSVSGVKLIIAGPTWEKNYKEKILKYYKDNVFFIGEIGGERKKQLIANAKAVLVLSQPILGPWGDIWNEPGATVVSESAVSGTPVISTENGCLSEITPNVGVVVPSMKHFTRGFATDVIDRLPLSKSVFSYAAREWHYVGIARKYADLYQYVILGRKWY